MISQQQFARRRAIRNEEKNTTPSYSQPDLRSRAESLLRDLALVLRSTATIRRAMDAESALCPAVS